MQEAQPRIKALRAISGRDMESRTKLNQEMRKVYKELGITFTSLWPILIQMPVLLALFKP